MRSGRGRWPASAGRRSLAASLAEVSDALPDAVEAQAESAQTSGSGWPWLWAWLVSAAACSNQRRRSARCFSREPHSNPLLRTRSTRGMREQATATRCNPIRRCCGRSACRSPPQSPLVSLAAQLLCSAPRRNPRVVRAPSHRPHLAGLTAGRSSAAARSPLMFVPFVEPEHHRQLSPRTQPHNQPPAFFITTATRDLGLHAR